MKCMVITSPELLSGEVFAIGHLLDRGVDVVHLRKPNCSLQQLTELLQHIPEHYHRRIMLHDHFELAAQFPVMGVHLNGRNPLPPIGFNRVVSRSCHTVAEVVEYKPQVNYLFLSPIFNSISKQGYQSNFTDQQLKELSQQHIIDHKVMALGGVSLDNIPQLKNYSFGGVALLGDVWQRFAQQPLSEVDAYLDRLLACLHQ